MILKPDDLLIVESGTPQKIESMRRVPASLLLLLDTGGDQRERGKKLAHNFPHGGRVIANRKKSAEMPPVKVCVSERFFRITF